MNALQNLLNGLTPVLAGGVFAYLLLLALSFLQPESVFGHLLKRDWIGGWLIAFGVVSAVAGYYLQGENGDFLLAAGGALIVWGILTALHDTPTRKVLSVNGLRKGLAAAGILAIVYYWVIPVAAPAVIQWLVNTFWYLYDLKPQPHQFTSNELMALLGLMLILMSILASPVASLLGKIKGLFNSFGHALKHAFGLS